MRLYIVQKIQSLLFVAKNQIVHAIVYLGKWERFAHFYSHQEKPTFYLSLSVFCSFFCLTTVIKFALCFGIFRSIMIFCLKIARTEDEMTAFDAFLQSSKKHPIHFKNTYLHLSKTWFAEKVASHLIIDRDWP